MNLAVRQKGAFASRLSIMQRMKSRFRKEPIQKTELPFLGELAGSMKVDWTSLGKRLKTFELRDSTLDLLIRGVQCRVTVTASPLMGKTITLESGLNGKPLLNKQKLFSLAEKLSGPKVVESEDYATSKIHGVVPVGESHVLIDGTLNIFDGKVPSLTVHLIPTRKIFGKVIPVNNNIATVRYSEISDKDCEHSISISGEKYVPGTPNFAVLRLIEDLIAK